MRKLKTWLMGAIALSLASQTLAAGPATLPPVDECQVKPGFPAMRARLAGVVQRKDVVGLKALVATDVANGFGGDDGKAAFIRQWELHKGAGSSVWAELSRLIPLGCALGREGEVVIPYAAERIPGDESVFYHVPVRPRVALRAAPRANAGVVATLGWDLLADHDTESVPEGWFGVTTPAGKKGYVRSIDVVSNSGQRIYVGKRKGQWMITGFLAGD